MSARFRDYAAVRFDLLRSELSRIYNHITGDTAGYAIVRKDEVREAVSAMENALPYVARHESENFSNAALDVLINLETAIHSLKQKEASNA